MFHRTLSIGMAAFATLTLAAGESSAQRYYSRPVYHSAVVHSSVVSTPASCKKAGSGAPSAEELLKDCHCDHHSNECDCECKDCLDCTITLPPNCHASDCTVTPISCDIVGEVPRVPVKTDCYVRTIKFRAMTQVPQIVCATRTCVEIDKKKIECLKGCDFEVCVPVNKCCEETVRCELTDQLMNIEAKLRDNGTWDIYVINGREGGQFFAGGMPRVWVLYHCLSLDKLQSHFPGQNFAQVTPEGADRSPVAKKQESKDSALAAAEVEPTSEKDEADKG